MTEKTIGFYTVLKIIYSDNLLSKKKQYVRHLLLCGKKHKIFLRNTFFITLVFQHQQDQKKNKIKNKLFLFRLGIISCLKKSTDVNKYNIE